MQTETSLIRSWSKSNIFLPQNRRVAEKASPVNKEGFVRGPGRQRTACPSRGARGPRAGVSHRLGPSLAGPGGCGLRPGPGASCAPPRSGGCQRGERITGCAATRLLCSVGRVGVHRLAQGRVPGEPWCFPAQWWDRPVVLCRSKNFTKRSKIEAGGVGGEGRQASAAQRGQGSTSLG